MATKDGKSLEELREAKIPPKVHVIDDTQDARPTVGRHLPKASEIVEAQVDAEADIRKRSNEAARKQAKVDSATHPASFLPDMPEDSNPGAG